MGEEVGLVEEKQYAAPKITGPDKKMMKTPNSTIPNTREVLNQSTASESLEGKEQERGFPSFLFSFFFFFLFVKKKGGGGVDSKLHKRLRTGEIYSREF